MGRGGLEKGALTTTSASWSNLHLAMTSRSGKSAWESVKTIVRNSLS